MKCRPGMAAVLAMVTCLDQGHAWQAQAAAGGYQGADKMLIPSRGWPCGMPDGIPVPEHGVPVFEATMKLDQAYDVGQTQYGHREVFVVQGGAVTGANINGTVMTGGLDFQLSSSNGWMEVEEILVLRTSEGAYIYLRCPGTAVDRSDVRIVPDFEAPNSSTCNWLNTGKYVGRRVVDMAAKTLKISVFNVANIQTPAGSAEAVRVTKPEGVRDQPWDFRKAAPGERRGDQLITENVTLAASQRVGAAKDRNRNIIPITGGTLTGKLNGKVLAGGADYQNLANPMTIDARYLWQTSEGDVIIVRNAGPINSLVPIFEVRVDSKYAWLNDGKYLSSSPRVGAGGVELKFYESQRD